MPARTEPTVFRCRGTPLCCLQSVLKERSSEHLQLLSRRSLIRRSLSRPAHLIRLTHLGCSVHLSRPNLRSRCLQIRPNHQIRQKCHCRLSLNRPIPYRLIQG